MFESLYFFLNYIGQIKVIWHSLPVEYLEQVILSADNKTCPISSPKLSSVKCKQHHPYVTHKAMEAQ
jgi:hypothetical protein